MSESTAMDQHPQDGNPAKGKAAENRKAGGRAKPAVSARRRARQAALQGLYQWLLNREDVGVIQAHVETHEVFPGCDRKHFEMLLQGCIEDVVSLEAVVGPHLDRPLAELSPVERAVLLVGTFELARCLDIPYRVVINEAVELAKSFGGTDGHKYVNGVLDKAAASLRAVEVQAARAQAR